MDKKWLQDELARHGRGAQTALAKHLGLNPTVVSKLVRSDRKITSEEADKIREFLTAPANGGPPTETADLPHAIVSRVRPTPGPPDVPLWASAAAGEDGALVLVPDPIDYLRRSERMLNVRNPFAFNILGASMSPAIEHGDQVIINPSIVARPGHDCVFIHEGPEGMLALVKRLLRPGSDYWRVRQFNEPKDFDISRKKWSRVHPIAEIRKAGVG